jgi:glutamate 5-kinase
MPPKGRLILDAGASRAVREQGRSLLAIGVTAVEGVFEKGEVVALIGPDGQEFARGLSNYDVATARSIAGQRSEVIGRVFGGIPYEEVIHRDNLVVTH